MRSDLFSEHQEVETSGQGHPMVLQNRRMVKMHLRPPQIPAVMARQGAMVAYQGDVRFAYQSAGVGGLIKKAVTGEGLPLMRVEGHGDVFFAADAQELFLVDLEDDALSVNGRNVLAFDPGLSWDIRKVGGAGMLGGGLFDTVLSGRGRVAVSAYGDPVVLRTDEAPTYVDTQSVICWSANLQTELKKSFSAGALVGRGSGEAFQLGLHGPGFVVVQASEGPTVPPHSH